MFYYSYKLKQPTRSVLKNQKKCKQTQKEPFRSFLQISFSALVVKNLETYE